MRIATCDRCQRVLWVNKATRQDHYLGEFCASCFERVDMDSPDRHKWSTGPLCEDTSDWQANAIRDLEEDR